jgi:eukaryotic-like serine/threonine-protein kinase
MGLGRLWKSLLEGGAVDIQMRYEILREAVSGTMSKFYKARDRSSREIVGLKVLDRKKTLTLEARFRGLNKPSEGEIAIQLNHPQIVKTFSQGVTTKGEPFLVMEYLDGPGLNSLIIGRHPALKEQQMTFLRHAAEAIDAVHKAGFIHRDICPRNFVANREINSLKLIDFGLTVPATPPFMQPGNRTGTPTYMSPEVVRRRHTDPRLDIFSFGVSAYELLTFQLPWERGTGDGMAAMAHSTHAPVPIDQHRPTIHPTLAKAIMACLAADRDERPDSMERFLQMIWGIDAIDVG